MKKIVIFDEEENLLNDLYEKLSQIGTIKDRYEVIPLSVDSFLSTINTLRERNSTFRRNTPWQTDNCLLDDTDIFIIDFDLRNNPATYNHDGEEVAYLARCFSSCGLIVVMNRFFDADFDLTLNGHLETFADLDINSKCLYNSNLWGEYEHGFNPWYWPNLPDYEEDFKKRASDVRDSIKSNTPIHAVLDFPEELFSMLPYRICQFLGGDPSKTSFRDFVTKSGNGLMLKDVKDIEIDKFDEVVARVGAARISKWLDSQVLPGQDILIDAPHLVTRYPSLFVGNPEDIDAWNATASKEKYTGIGLIAGQVERYRFKKDHWLSKPVWLWSEMREDEDIPEVQEPWKANPPEWVFCEDASAFYSEGYKEFLADMDSPFNRRFAKKFEGYIYNPIVRLSK